MKILLDYDRPSHGRRLHSSSCLVPVAFAMAMLRQLFSSGLIVTPKSSCFRPFRSEFDKVYNGL